jgi:hypothetical protein
MACIGSAKLRKIEAYQFVSRRAKHCFQDSEGQRSRWRIPRARVLPSSVGWAAERPFVISKANIVQQTVEFKSKQGCCIVRPA